jgi:hypothetical protein
MENGNLLLIIVRNNAKRMAIGLRQCPEKRLHYHVATMREVQEEAERVAIMANGNQCAVNVSRHNVPLKASGEQLQLVKMLLSDAVLEKVEARKHDDAALMEHGKQFVENVKNNAQAMDHGKKLRLAQLIKIVVPQMKQEMEHLERVMRMEHGVQLRAIVSN